MARPTASRLRRESLEDRNTPVNLDPTYGTNGASDPFPDGTGPPATGPVLLPDGAAVQTAVQANYNPDTRLVEYAVRLTRFGSDGRPDPTFGDGGTKVPPIPLVDRGRTTFLGSVTTDPSYSHGGAWPLADDGVLVRLVSSRWAGGGYAEDEWVARFRPDGSLDPAYGENGLAHLPDAGKRSPVANEAFDYYLAQPDGGFIHFWSDLSLESEAVRLTPQGQLDAAFGVRRVNFGVFGTIPGTAAAATAPDGKIILVSWLREGISRTSTVVVRLNPDGSPDGSFGTNGEVRLVGRATWSTTSLRRRSSRWPTAASSWPAGWLYSPPGPGCRPINSSS